METSPTLVAVVAPIVVTETTTETTAEDNDGLTV